MPKRRARSDSLVCEAPEEDIAGVLARAESVNTKKSLGIIRLDFPYPINNGDVDNPKSFGYRVIYYVVKGFTFEMLLSGKMSKAVEKGFIAAVKWLEESGAEGISGDCGYMYLFQDLARKHANVPVFMSSLCQLPFIEMALKPHHKILIMTSSGANFDKIRSTLPQSQSERIVVAGCEDVPYFDALAKVEKVQEDKCAPRLLKLAKKQLAKDKAIWAILIECTQMPAFSNYFREELGVPVFDIITCLNYFHSSRELNVKTRFH